MTTIGIMVARTITITDKRLRGLERHAERSPSMAEIRHVVEQDRRVAAYLADLRVDWRKSVGGPDTIQILPAAEASGGLSGLTHSGMLRKRRFGAGNTFFIYLTESYLGLAGTLAHELGHVAQECVRPTRRVRTSPFAELDADARAQAYGFDLTTLTRERLKRTSYLVSTSTGRWLTQRHLYGDTRMRESVERVHAIRSNPLFAAYAASEWFKYPTDTIWDDDDLLAAKKAWERWSRKYKHC